MPAIIGNGTPLECVAIDRRNIPISKDPSHDFRVAAMSLLHATWLPAIRTPTSSGRPALLVWADTWRVASPAGPGDTPALHPLTLNPEELRSWLKEKDLLHQLMGMKM